MWSAIASVLLGGAGWLVTSFFAKPLLDFLQLRSQVHEEIIVTGNVGPIVAHSPDFDKAMNALRRLGAKVQATNATGSIVLRLFLDKTGFDLRKAGGGLIGLSNSLANTDGSRALQINSVQVGLKLPRDYDDEMLRNIVRRISGAA